MKKLGLALTVALIAFAVSCSTAEKIDKIIDQVVAKAMASFPPPAK